jgi:hypothetical protein
MIKSRNILYMKSFICFLFPLERLVTVNDEALILIVYSKSNLDSFDFSAI